MQCWAGCKCCGCGASMVNSLGFAIPAEAQRLSGAEAETDLRPRDDESERTNGDVYHPRAAFFVLISRSIWQSDVFRNLGLHRLHAGLT